MIELTHKNTAYKVNLDPRNSTCEINGRTIGYELINASEHTVTIKIDDQIHTLCIGKQNGGYTATIDGVEIEATKSDKLDAALKMLGIETGLNDQVKEIKAPMPGSILSISVNEGDAVAKGDALLILEAMKMENVIKSPVDGTIGKINVSVGESVAKNSNLISFG